LRPDTGDKVLSPDLGQVGIPLDLGNQRNQGATRHRALHRSDPGAKSGEEVPSQRTGVGSRLTSEEGSRESFEDQRAFRRPPPVDSGLAHPGSLSHLIHRQVDKAALLEDLVGRFEDCAMGTFAAGPSPRSGLRNRGVIHG